MTPKVFVAVSSFGECGDTPLQLLKGSGVDFLINPLARRLKQDEIVRFGQECEGIIAGVEPYDEYVLSRLTNLKCISRCGTGLDNIATSSAHEKGVTVLHTPDAPTDSVAEFTVGLILAVTRHLPAHDRWTKARLWRKEMGTLLRRKTLGVIGLGRIGRRVVELLMPFGMTVVGTDLTPDLGWAGRHGVELSSLQGVLSVSDVVTIHVSVSGDFRIGAEELSLMKAGAYLINTSRGAVLDEGALYEALTSARLAGAALDVFSEEPYTGPLCDLENVILSPHAATLTSECRLTMETEAVRNLLNYFARVPCS